MLSIAHLGDAERMFFVTLLLYEVITWMRTQAGTSSLRALVFMDEVAGYLPPVAMPPAKKPMLTLLKQARAFGVGMLLATQNPVDVDYKALANAGTWFLGRLQTERDKARVIEGLEGASAAAGKAFDRAAIGASVLGALFGGRRGSVGKVASAARSVSRTAAQRDDVARAQASASQLRDQRSELERELADDVAELQARPEPEIEVLELKAKKGDTAVTQLSILWR